MAFFESVRDKAVSTFSQVLDRKDPSGLSKEELFCRDNHIPDGERVKADNAAEIKVKLESKKEMSRRGQLPQGKIFVTDHFLIFQDAFDKKNCSFSIHLSTVKKVERLQTTSYGSELVVITHSNLSLVLYLVGLRTDCERFATAFKISLKNNLPNVPKLKPFVQTLYSEYLLSKNRISNENIEHIPEVGLGMLFKYPGDAKALKDKAKMKLWFDLFRVDGRNLSIVKTPMFYKLVRVGLPNRLRGEIWELCSGSMYSRLDNQDVYKGLLEHNEGKSSLAIEEIEKDLNRSLPEYAAYQDKEGIDRLRRVLTAYSWRNPEVGYCQAMNIVSAALLIYMSEEQAFWALDLLIDRIVPGYYSKTMYGALLDQKVFDSLVEQTMPMVWDHLTKYDIQLSVVTFPWFLSLYLSSMPLVFASRIIDVFFLQGPKTLFQVALGILKMCGDELLATEDDGSFISVIKEFLLNLEGSAHPNSPTTSYRQITNFQELLVTSFKEFASIDDDVINKYRNKHRDTIYQNISGFIKRTELRNLPKIPNIDQSTLSIVYDRFYSTVQSHNVTGGDSSTMDFDMFMRFMSEITDFVSNERKNGEARNGLPFLQRLFNSWASDPTEGLTLTELVVGINKLVEPDLMTSLNNFFGLYDPDKRDKLDRETILKVSEDLLFITLPWRDLQLLDKVTQDKINKAEADEKRKVEEGSKSPANQDQELENIRSRFENEQAERYLSATSNFIQRAFEYAQPDDEEVLIKELSIDSKIIHNAALNPNSPVFVNLPTFRMVVLADETYELLFAYTLRSSIHLSRPLDSKVSSMRTLRDMFDGLLADGREAANKVRRRMDSSASSAQTSNVSNEKQNKSDKAHEDEDEERDDDFGVISINEQDKDLLLGTDTNALVNGGGVLSPEIVHQNRSSTSASEERTSIDKSELNKIVKQDDSLIEFET